MTRVSKDQLIRAASAASGFPITEVRATVEAFLREVFAQAAKGHDVEIRDFGTFFTKERKARPARNPKTGEIVPLPDRWVFLLRFSPAIKDTAGKHVTRSAAGTYN